MLLNFYCDESYDGHPATNLDWVKEEKFHEPRTYVVAGLLSDQSTWTRVEQAWAAINEIEKVSRYHASHLNCRDHEYAGWSTTRQRAYSSELLNVIVREGLNMNGFTCGILANKYREILSEEGRRKLGPPYLMCFQTCLALLGQAMDKNGLPPDDKVAVFIDSGPFEKELEASFNRLMNDSDFPYRSRFATCTPASAEEVIPLQAADMLAYEYFKRLHTVHEGATGNMRAVLSILRDTIGYDGGNYFSERILSDLVPGIESAICAPGTLVVLPRPESIS